MNQHEVGTRFPLGRVVATPTALKLLDDNSVTVASLLDRHARGDWGAVSPEDARLNHDAVATGVRLLSAYAVGCERVWIITESDRSVTTVLLPIEY